MLENVITLPTMVYVQQGKLVQSLDCSQHYFDPSEKMPDASSAWKNANS